ncbi:MBL fold metallo-hydrolase [Flavobacterium lutivivi]|nr:MBL fold metallo-hydrolase [Flavobacterium lutivivi]
MQIYFLGTGTSQGIPVIGSHHSVCLSNNPKDKRLRVSVWIKTEKASIVIDCGPDFRQQMLVSNCQKIDAILFTHEHADHTAGLDDIRPFYFKQGKDIPIFAQKRVLDNLARRFDYIFEKENKYPGSPSVEVNEINVSESFSVNGEKILPISVQHGNLEILGFRVGDFAYITDASAIIESELSKLKNLKVLVINALREETHHSHFSLSEALNFIHLIQPEKAYLTHISHLLGFHDEVEKNLPPNVYLAYDNLVLTI